MNSEEEAAALSRAGVEVPLENLSCAAVIVVEGCAFAVRESAVEIMALREEAIVQRTEILNGEEPETAAMVWLTLTGSNGRPIYVDPMQLTAVSSNREAAED